MRCVFHCQVPKGTTQGYVLAKETLSYPGITGENTRDLPQIQTKPLWLKKMGKKEQNDNTGFTTNNTANAENG